MSITLAIKNVIAGLVMGYLRQFGPDKAYLSLIHWMRFRRWPSYTHPKTFNEKLQCVKLYDRNPLFTICADKYLVRDFVKERVGEKYLVKLYAVFDTPEDLTLNNLPTKFALKVNTGSKGNILCHDKEKLNLEEAKQLFKDAYKLEFYKRYREYHYRDIKKKIICEELLENTDGTPLFDWKFFCFNGEPYILMVELGEKYEGRRNIYNMDWTRHDGCITNPQDFEYEVPRPDNFDEMLNVVRKLAAGFNHVRVDLYYVNKNIYFGELTFTSAGGFLPFSSYEFDLEMGNQFEVPTKKVKYKKIIIKSDEKY